MVLLERLSDARRLGHPVLATVRGTALNQDGASNGLTAPSGAAQQKAIEQALADAVLTGHDVDVVEAHGTGTRLGDPIEANALLATYGRERDPARPLWLGSVKSNLGHTQAAAGVAGLIKMVLAMQHGLLPRTLHVDTPTRHVEWDGAGVRVLTEARPWDTAADRPRRAGISAFGISGTNAHVILEAPDRADAAEPAGEPRPRLVAVPLSARSEPALAAQATRVRALLADPAITEADLGYSLGLSRAALDHRVVVVADNRDELLAGLDEIAGTGLPGATVVRGTTGPAGKTVFVFPGQGSQWIGMAVGLLDSCEPFAARLHECDRALRAYVPWSPIDVLRGTPGGPDLNRVDVVQPLLWAVMVSLAEAWRSSGVQPDAVVGHSQGEIAAACVAGALSLEDGARVVALRSQALSAIAGRGGMVSLAVPAADVRELIAGWDGRIGVAAVNGPAATVVSGDADALAELMAVCERDGLRARTVPVDYASHGPHVDAIRDRLAEVLTGITPRAADVAFYSTVTGAVTDGASLDAGYWFTNLRQPVELEQAVRRLAIDGYRVFIECSPHPVLTSGVQGTVDDLGPAVGQVTVVGTLRRDDGGPRRLLTSLAEAWAGNARVDWGRAVGPARRIDLPTYPFQRTRYWLAPPERTIVAESAADARFWDSVTRTDVAQVARELSVRPDTPLEAVVPALSSWRRRAQDEARADGWRYRLQWQRHQAGTAVRGHWLVVVTGDGRDSATYAAVVAALSARGVQVSTLVVPAAERGPVSEALASAGPADGVLSLLTLDETPDAAHPDLPAGLTAQLALIQALADRPVAPLWTVTRGAVSTGATDTASAAAQAAAWGLGGVAAVEQPALHGALVDLPEELDNAALDRFCAVLGTAAGTEDRFAVRGGAVLVPRLARAPRTTGASAWQPSGTVLVVGGTGGLGAHVARRLAEQGVSRLVLAGRRGPQAPGAEELAAELTAAGTPTTVVACDAADRDALAALLDSVRGGDTPLTAVVHTAGVRADAPAGELTAESLAAAHRGRALVAANLTELVDEQLVLFSALSAVLGLPGQAGYAGGNAVVESLARQRAAAGRPVVCLGWGPWADSGVAEDPETIAVQHRHGIPPMEPRVALAAMGDAIADGEVSLYVADIDWRRFGAAFTASGSRPLIAGIPEARTGGAEEEPATAGAGTALAAQLAAVPEADQLRMLLEAVQVQVALVLGHGSAGPIRPDMPFKDVGFDSIMGVELRNRLNRLTGLRLPATLVFDYPSPVVLAEYLRAELAGVTAGPGEVACPGASDEPIAIVGMSCRFPGGVRGPDDLWRLVESGTDAVAEWPEDRGWDAAGLYHPDPDETGRTYTVSGGFLDEPAHFDAGFFGISPKEATAMDPQQRLLLESTWEALEQAGLDPHGVRGSRTGVFVGMSYQDYLARLRHAPDGFEGHLMMGNTASVGSGRVAYTFGLEGPALTIDTACSSSLVAMHLAARSLRSGECTMALAGAVVVMATPGMFLEFSRQRALAPDGRCKAFGADADGFGAAEGVGMLVMERLSDAVANGHRVLAVVRGTATNQDGASNGLSAPNGPAQQRVIRQALSDAGLTAGEVDAVEAHGTGTALGDPIEAQALFATYGRDRNPEQPLWLGSLKSNIGHAQAAAGVGGVIKMIMAMRHGTLPRTLHADVPSPHIDWSPGTIKLLGENLPWPSTGRPRRSAVSSFGISGTNAHVILEEPPAPAEVPPAGAPAAPVLPILLSAASEAALRDQATLLRAQLSPAVALPDLAHALSFGRARLRHRAVLLAGDHDRLGDALDALAGQRPSADVVLGAANPAGRTVLVFPGQGSQWPAMARELLDTSPVFTGAIEECERALQRYVPWSLTAVLRGEPGTPELTAAEVVQPVLFAVMVALARLWETFGIRPDAVVGHSQGEIAAAHIAGALSLDDAARVVALRSQALTAITGRGAMASVALTAADVRERLSAWPGRLDVAVVNGPRATVLSGDADAVAEFVAACEAEGIRARTVPVDYASHGPHVDAIRERLAEVLSGIEPRTAPIAFYSTVTGEPVDTAGLDAGYWFTNLRQPVEFERAVRRLAADGFRTFVESSPHPVLLTGLQDTLEDAGITDAVCTGTLRRDEGGLVRVLTGAAELFVRGAPADFTGYLPGTGRPVDLPTYPFQRQRYWLEAPAEAADAGELGLEPVSHPLLGAAVAMADGDATVLTASLSTRTHPWLADHAVHGTVLLPGAALVELAVRAGDQAGCGHLRELTLQAPLILTGEAAQVQVVLGGAGADGARPVSIHSRTPGRPWVCHAEGVVDDAAPAAEFTLDAWPPPGAEPIPLDDLYARLAEVGLDYGPAFRGLRAAWQRDDRVYTEVVLAAGAPDGFGIHPALLDAALQGVALTPAAAAVGNGIVLPFAWSGVTLHAVGASALRVELRPAGPGAVGLRMADASGAALATVEELSLRPVSRGQLDLARTSHHDAEHTVAWQPFTAGGEPSPCAVLGDFPYDLGPATVRATDLDALREAPVPPAVLVAAPREVPAGDPRAAIEPVLRLLQQWLRDPAFEGSRLVVITHDAAAVRPGEHLTGLASSSVWGLVRSAESEHPGRFSLVDLDGRPGAAAALPAAVWTGEPQVAVREGALFVPRLVRARADRALVPPAGAETWQLVVDGAGGFDDLALAEFPQATAPLTDGQLRLSVRAVGVNFRDVVLALGMVAQDGRAAATEAAGVVLEVGPGVTGVRPGDRVMGLMSAGVGPVTTTDHRLVTRIPDGWSFAQAAATPAAFLTALYALRDLAQAQPGERLLLHAAAGGVGMAATQVARHLGLQVYGTAHPGKWETLRRLGYPDAHIASSRTLDFEQAFSGGVDIVLNSLAGDFVDGSLRLLRSGGRFVEMGKTDIRDAEAVAGAHPGVHYQSFDVLDRGPEHVRAMLADLLELAEQGVISPLPITAFDIRQAPAAFRHLSQARHTGKIVLTLPAPLDPEGTVLVTGATGTLAGHLIDHLVTRHGVRHLLLAGRQGPHHPRAAELTARLEGLGARVTLAACDTGDPADLTRLLSMVDPAHPLTTVVHTAGALADATLDALTEHHLQTALRGKAEGAWHLHTAIRNHPVTQFLMFSSAAGTLGNAGQANYAAANAYLDALAQHRHAAGEPATSLAWGLWDLPDGMTGHLRAADHARVARSGVLPFSIAEGLAMFDDALAAGLPVHILNRFSPSALRARAEAKMLPPILTGLAARPARRTAADGDIGGSMTLSRRLAALDQAGQVDHVLDLLRRHVATVLGHTDPNALDAGLALKELGFDSLSAVEFRNRVNAATGLRLPATAVFEYPTLDALSRHVIGELAPAAEPAGAPAAVLGELARVETMLGTVQLDDAAQSAVGRRLRDLLARVDGTAAGSDGTADRLAEASDDEIFDFIERELKI
ncbi:SDR family NAD(P)-dependent oxidoreductase [Micromonospora zhanjiangensis]